MHLADQKPCHETSGIEIQLAESAQLRRGVAINTTFDALRVGRMLVQGRKRIHTGSGLPDSAPWHIY